MAYENWVARRAGELPDRIALLTDEGSLTYRELAQEAAVAAEALKAQGVGPGDTVPIEIAAGAEYVVRLHALTGLGATAFPLDPRLTGGERAAALDESGTAANAHTRLLTSGSAGRPKAIGLTHANHYWSAVGSALNLGVEPDDRWLCCLPVFHVSGLTILMRSAIYGTAAVVHDGFDTDRVAAELESGEITLVSLVATQLARLLDAGADVAAPRVLVLGGGPLPGDLLEEALGRGATVVQTYGMTETCSQVATLAPSNARGKSGSAGRPLLSANIHIDDGEILIQGPTVAPGTAAEDGWLHTGDLGRFDEEGCLWVTGRRTETIISGGEKVMPAEVEEVLRRHPAIVDAAVVGRPDPEWQEAVTAVIVLESGQRPSDEELRAHCAASLAAFKVPKRFEVADLLPRTPAGKLQRHRLGS
ncbi:MAG: AMP-binding protein [Solirubrobacterales bacterium]